MRATLLICAAATIAFASPLAGAKNHSPIAAKSAGETPSGFPVPRYVSLKYNNVNGRTGPSENHPVKWNYRRRGMPVIIIAETEMWRKIRDENGDESWMHKRTLDGRRMVLTRQDVTLRAKPRKTAKGRAVAAKDSLLSLDECDQTGWCEVKAETGHWGYVQKKTIWGLDLPR